jgi:hypothetical protein
MSLGGRDPLCVLRSNRPGANGKAGSDRYYSFGICVVSFTLEQLFYLSGTTSLVPKWIPPGQMFWAIATTVFFALAAIALLTGLMARLASGLTTAMIVGFGLRRKPIPVTLLKEGVRPREKHAEQSKKNEGEGDQKRRAHTIHANTVNSLRG